MVAKRKGLGRGLDALIGPLPRPGIPEAEAAGAPGEGELRRLPLDRLQPGKYQPRLDMRPETLTDLADSIRAQGVVQPIIVRSVGPPNERRYEIIAGERRWRAAQMAGLDSVPAVVHEVSDQAAVAMALIENIQRENLNPLEEARALERLIGEFDMTHQLAAQAVGRSRASVSNLLRLLDLDGPVKLMLERREIEMGHARALLALPPEQQAGAARQVARKGLSARETERLVKRLRAEAEGTGPPAGRATSDPNLRRLETDLSEKLGAAVELRPGTGGKGRLVIRYHSLEELDGILEHIR